MMLLCVSGEISIILLCKSSTISLKRVALADKVNRNNTKDLLLFLKNKIEDLK